MESRVKPLNDAAVGVELVQFLLGKSKRQLPPQRPRLAAVATVGDARVGGNFSDATVGLLVIGKILDGFGIKLRHVVVVQKRLGSGHNIAAVAHFFAGGAVRLHAENIAQKRVLNHPVQFIK